MVKGPLYLICGIALAASVASANAQTEDAAQKFEDLIHSDLPLIGDDVEIWPKSFSNPDTGEFGCQSRIIYGDWVLRAADDPDGADPLWYGFSNYGVFHCFSLVSKGGEREELSRAELRPAHFINLGSSGGVELWALQIGVRPGSDYLLLSRKPAPDGISEFTVLQRKCPARNIRDAGAMDALLTKYCAINSMTAFRALARRMAKLEPLGTLSLVSASE